MRFKPFITLLILSITIILFYSCSSTKYVPEGEYWLKSATVKSDTKALSPLDIEPYIHQRGNYKTLALFRLPLFIYNLSGRDTTKWVNRVLRSGGEPPVIYDSTQVQKSVDDITRLMENKGYVHAKVIPEIKTGNKKVDVKYIIESGNPYAISEYAVNVPDSVLADTTFYTETRIAQNNGYDLNEFLAHNSPIKNGSIFDLDLLDEERDRVTSTLRRFGYYDFDKEYIGFIADTAAGKDRVDLELVIYPFMERLEGGNIEEDLHRRYIVRDVSFYVDYNPLEDGDIANYLATDTIYRLDGGYKIYYGRRGRYIKPFVITGNCYIQPGTYYNENATSLTYNALSQLHILRNVNIRYEKVVENDSVQLRCVITCVPGKRQGISTEIEGTNSGGSFGIGAGIGYTHRNAFKGSELFNIKLQGAYEALGSSSFSNFDKNYFEIGGEMSVSFPRFMFPFLTRDFRRGVRASTQFTSNYVFQRRPDFFTRTILSSRMSYIWQNRRNTRIRHTVDLIDVSYIHIPSLSNEFENTLTDASRVYSFQDQFILGTGYTYTNSNFNPISSRRRLNSVYSFRFSAESAGNLLDLIAIAAGVDKDPEEGRKIFDTRYSQYISGNFDFSRTIPFDEKNSVTWRVGAGIVFPYGNNKLVPIQKRFFSGGANSVRGWSIRELGPGAYNKSGANFYDHSGDIRFDANIEYRSKVFWKLELAAFLDAGNIWTVKEHEEQKRGQFKIDSFYKQIAGGWGLGFRFDFDFVLIRLDAGWKLYNPASKYRENSDGTFVKEKSNFHWPVLKPLDLKKNAAWHFAVGYPF